jgi:hypothetical protein
VVSVKDRSLSGESLRVGFRTDPLREKSCDVMDAFEKAGWEWISAEKAFEDPVFHRQPQTLPAGENLVWARAAEGGKFKGRLRYPGEDDVYEKPKMDALRL